ncbi:general transcriptional corepressor Tup1p [Trichomonascus vanleenenianus]|uniref:chromatin-silencing transcriptional regulator TUP1 n=1 Tax=Trichomonascus vanleenenianus TaxID=2268995 RepID=UPI003EC98C0C
MIPGGHHRLNELLDGIKQEFDNMTNEASVYRMHKDEFDHKFNQQNAEMQQVRQMIYDLESTHRKMKESYEEEIARLKRELEARGGAAVANQAIPPQQPQQVPQQAPPQMGPQPQPGQPPALGHTNNVFGGIMSQQQAAQQQGQPAGASPLAPPQQPQQPQQQQQPGYPGYNGYTTPSTPAAASANAAAAPAQSTPQQLSPGGVKKHETNGTPNNTNANNQLNNSAAAVNAAAAATTTKMTEAQSAVALGNNLGDLEVDKVPPELKKEKSDWFVLYNERAPRVLDVDIVQSLDHHSVVCCVRFSFDGKYIATGCNRSAQIFEVATGNLVAKLQDDSVDREGDLYIRSVCFSPDGKYLATGAEDRQIRVWDIKSRTIRYLFSGHEQDIYSLDFSRNGRHIASGSGDRTVRMWDMESGQCILTLSIEDGVTTVAISPDGRYVAAGSLDKTVRVWETSTGFLVERLEVPDGHKDSVYSVGFTPDGKQLVSGSLDKTIKLWELQAPQAGHSTHKGGVCVKTFVGHKDFVLSVASTPDNQWIISGSKDRGVQFWDPRTAQVQLMLQGHKNSVISVAPSPTGGLFATGSGDCRARIWRYYNVAR